MDFPKERQAIIEVGQRLYDRGLVVANDGNVSMRLPDGTILCTPTGVSKGGMTPEMLPRVSLEGTVLYALEGKGPSSEIKMHLRVYERDQSASGVVHAHPPYATAFAIRGETFDAPMMPETVVALPSIPLAGYATPSTHEVPDSIEPFVGTTSACLLEHHGALTWGPSLEQAMLSMERLEYMATVTAITRQLGGERRLSDERITRLKEIFGT